MVASGSDPQLLVAQDGSLAKLAPEENRLLLTLPTEHGQRHASNLFGNGPLQDSGPVLAAEAEFTSHVSFDMETRTANDITIYWLREASSAVPNPLPASLQDSVVRSDR